MKKILAILLASVLTATALIGCSQKKPVNEEHETVVENGSENAEGTENTIVKTPVSYNDRVAAIEEAAGTVESDEIIVMTIGGYDISLAEYEYACISTVNQAMQMAYYGYGFDIFEDEEFIAEMENVFNIELKMAPAILTMAASKGVDITDEEFDEKVITPYNSLLEENGGSLDELLSEPLSPTIKAYLHFNLIYALYENIADTYSGTDALDTANEVLEKVNAGEDFDALIEEYNEDPGMAASPNGYYFTYGAMVAPFEETSFALAENEISGIVETDYGYHIIKRLPVDDEFKETEEYNSVYESLSEQYEGEELENALGEYVRVKHILIQFPDPMSLCYTDLEASLGNFEIVKVENFDELTAPVHEEINTFIADSKVQFEAMYGSSEEETVEEETTENTEEEAAAEVEVEAEPETETEAE